MAITGGAVAGGADAHDPGRLDAFSRGSAIRRAGYAGFKRHVAVALGNWLAGLEREPPEEAVVVLQEALEDESEIVRQHAAWALERSAVER